MTSKEFIAKLRDIAAIKTIYMWGMFGGLVTEARIAEKVKQYPYNYSVAKQAQLRALVGKNVYAFDCVGLIKGILWGWFGDSKHLHGGAKYASNGVPDIDANVMIARCKDVSTDFSKIIPGSAVWLQGHIGVYIGDGKVIEATPAWTDGVQTTACLNIGPIAGLNGRKWVKHGQLPWVEYVVEPVQQLPKLPLMPKTIVPTLVHDEETGQTHAAYIIDGATYAPVRAVAEAGGRTVNYNATTKETTLKLKK